MLTAALIFAIQNNNEQAQVSGNLNGGLLLVFAMVAVVMALIVVMFIRTSMRRSPRR